MHVAALPPLLPLAYKQWRVPAPCGLHRHRLLCVLSVSSRGGYQFRLCPASEPLTEACFQRHPLVFNGSSDRSAGAYRQTLRWSDGTEQRITAGLVWVSPPHASRSPAASRSTPASIEPNPVGYPWACVAGWIEARVQI